jgi:hypothetical protein
MKNTVVLPHSRVSRFICLSCLILLLGAAAGRAEQVEAISSKVSRDYVRAKAADGSFVPETYAFGEGDNWGGARVDASMDSLTFMDVARTIAAPLANKKYIPTRDPKTTKLLIMVYWGTTRSPEHSADTNTTQKMHDADRDQDQAQMALNHATKPADVKVAVAEMQSAEASMRAAVAEMQSEDQRREDTDVATVTLLGYDSWWMSTESASGGGERAMRKKDMLDEVEEDRYFVVLMAYDFQAMAKKKKKLLWEVHFSIREHGTEFDKRLPGMVADASEFFGRDSNGLHHVELPEGTVTVGPVRSLGVLPSK